MKLSDRPTERPTEAEWQQYKAIYAHQLTPNSKIVVTTNDGSTYHLEPMAPEREYKCGRDSIIKNKKIEGEHYECLNGLQEVAKDGKGTRIMLGRVQPAPGGENIIDTLIITYATDQDSIGNLGLPEKGIRLGEPLVLTTALCGFESSPVKQIKALHVVPDENSSYVEKLLLATRSQTRKAIREAVERESWESFNLCLKSPNIAFTKIPREDGIDILDPAIKASYYIHQLVADLEKETNPMLPEILQDIFQLIFFVKSRCSGNAKGMVGNKSVIFSVQNGTTTPTRYKLTAAYLPYNDEVIYLNCEPVE